MYPFLEVLAFWGAIIGVVGAICITMFSVGTHFQQGKTSQPFQHRPEPAKREHDVRHAA